MSLGFRQQRMLVVYQRPQQCMEHHVAEERQWFALAHQLGIHAPERYRPGFGDVGQGQAFGQ